MSEVHAHDPRGPLKRCRLGTPGCFVGRYSHGEGCQVVAQPSATEHVDTAVAGGVQKLQAQRNEALIRVARACQTIISMACQIHQAYHEGDPTTCPRGFCEGARLSADGLRGESGALEDVGST